MSATAPSMLLRDARVTHPESATTQRVDILVIDGVITEIEPRLRPGSEAIPEFNLHGLYVFPGLIDAHVHVTAVRHDLRESAALPGTYVSAAAGQILRGMLARGFTTVRDLGGADWGLALAAADGSLGAVPRLVFCGKALSQTGGHGDLRPRGVDRAPCCSIGEVCDGPVEVRRAVRGHAARGAGHVKLMLGGGVTSEFDRIDGLQFSDEEVGAAVAEAKAAGTYVAAHAYTAEAISRAVRLGVRSIEHGNLLDEPTAVELAGAGVFLVPTLVTYEDLVDMIARNDAPEHLTRKLREVRETGLQGLELAQRAGVRIVFGTDLLGSGHVRQLEEFRIRSTVQSPAALLASATTAAADLLGMAGQIGTVRVGATADLVVSELDPLRLPLSEVLDSPFAVMAGGRAGQSFRDLLTRPVSGSHEHWREVG